MVPQGMQQIAQVVQAVCDVWVPLGESLAKDGQSLLVALAGSGIILQGMQ